MTPKRKPSRKPRVVKAWALFQNGAIWYDSLGHLLYRTQEEFGPERLDRFGPKTDIRRVEIREVKR